MSVIIKKCTVSEVENTSNFQDLVDAYEKEVRVEGAPPIAVKKEIYRSLEKLGVFQFFGAYIDDVLIGFITVLATVLPHYGVIMAVSESFFVLKDYRKTGAGNKLRIVAEDYSKEIKSPCLLISAPYGGILSDVLFGLDEYKPTNTVFFRNLANV